MLKTTLTAYTFCAVALFACCGFTSGASSCIKEGNRLYGEKKFDPALEKYQQATQLAPNTWQPHYNTANTLYKKGNYQDAITAFDTAAKTAPADMRPDIHYNKGNCLFRQGKLEDALKEYKSALELDRNDQDIKFNIEFTQKKIEEMKKQQQDTKKRQKQEKQKQQQQNQNKDKQDKDQQDKQDKNQQDKDKQNQDKKDKNRQNDKNKDKNQNNQSDDKKQKQDDKQQKDSRKDDKKDKKESGQNKQDQQDKQKKDEKKQDQSKSSGSSGKKDEQQKQNAAAASAGKEKPVSPEEKKDIERLLESLNTEQKARADYLKHRSKGEDTNVAKNW